MSPVVTTMSCVFVSQFVLFHSHNPKAVSIEDTVSSYN